METNPKSPTLVWITRKSIIPLQMSLVLSAKVRRNLPQNERLWQTLDIDNVFMLTIGCGDSR